MTITENKDLLALNTFQISARAKYFMDIENEESLLQVIKNKEWKQRPLFIIGGGSNILLTKDIDGLLIKNSIKGIAKLNETSEAVEVCFGAGENWHECVLWSLSQQLSGIENLSLIPGTIGAAPIQNIGAYGVELKDVFVSLEGIEIATGEKRIFTKDECAFGYRTSIFKTSLKDKFIINKVILRLSKKAVFHTSYGNIKHELNEMGVMELSAKAISDAVINIRKSKLPDPKVIGNAGSFFKNPTISVEAYNELIARNPTMPSYPVEDGMKIPAAWLIEHTHPKDANSWKGYKIDNYGVHNKQALCLVNYGGANGKDIYALSAAIITSVQQTFNILLEREVNIW